MKRFQHTTSSVKTRGSVSPPGGVTLSEVLVSMLIMSVGVVSLATLFPISVLRTAQATQLTHSVFLRNNAEAAVESVTRMGLDPVAEAEALATDSEPVRMVPMLARQTERVAFAEAIPMDMPRSTLPFPPVILPIENGPPTYVYGNELKDDPELAGPSRPVAQEPWMGSTDRVG